MSVDVYSMFDKLVDTLKEKESSNSYKNYENLLKLEKENTYLVRLVMHPDGADKTFLTYHYHGWKSLSTGKYTTTLCPTTLGERCPICEERIKLYRTENAESIALAKVIKKKSYNLANVYVIDCPSKEEDNGKVKILRMSNKLYGAVQEGISGDDKDDFGPKVFDLSEKGCNFRIKVTTQPLGNITIANYDKSTYRMPSEIPGMTEEKMEEVYESVFDLDEYMIKKNTTAEMVNMLKEHLFCEEIDSSENAGDSLPDTLDDGSSINSDIEDIIGASDEKKPATKKVTKKATKKAPVEEEVEDDIPMGDDIMEDLMGGLEELELESME